MYDGLPSPSTYAWTGLEAHPTLLFGIELVNVANCSGPLSLVK